MGNLTWTTERRTLRDLLPHPHNPRRLTPTQRQHLTRSLEKFGLADPPVVNPDGTIIGGHQRITILTDLYGENHELDVRIPNRPLTEEETRELNIRLNQNSGEWDEAILLEYFDDTELIAWGFEPPELPGPGEDPKETWVGTIEYEQEDQTAYRQIVVNFKTDEDAEAFAAALGISITKKTRSIWHPPVPWEDTRHLHWTDEEGTENADTPG